MPVTSLDVLYQCPGEAHPIEPAVHWARLASYYHACRDCVHRDQTGPLAGSVKRHLLAARRRAATWTPFGAESIRGVVQNQLTPRVARDVALALGTYLGGSTARPVLAAWDGRAHSAPLVNGVCEGLAWAGCAVAELGTLTAPRFAHAIQLQQAAGGIYIGNAAGQVQTCDLTCWGPGGRPMSSPGELDLVREMHQNTLGRVSRAAGVCRRGHAGDDYLRRLEPHFHALRPLRLVLETTSRALVADLHRLGRPVACQVLRFGHLALSGTDGDAASPPQDACSSTRDLGAAVLAARAHFGIWIDGDGEVCRLIDECGHEVLAANLLRALARDLLPPRAVVVLERETPSRVSDALRADGHALVASSAHRAAMHDSMITQNAQWGGGPSGRFWFGPAPALADGLHLLAYVLTLLSRTDRPLSAVVQL